MALTASSGVEAFAAFTLFCRTVFAPWLALPVLASGAAGTFPGYPEATASANAEFGDRKSQPGMADVAPTVQSIVRNQERRVRPARLGDKSLNVARGAADCPAVAL